MKARSESGFTVLQRLLLSFLLMTSLVLGASGAGLWFTASVEASIANLQQGYELLSGVDDLQLSWRNVVEIVDKMLQTRAFSTTQSELLVGVEEFKRQLENLAAPETGQLPENKVPSMSAEEKAANQLLLQDIRRISGEFTNTVNEFTTLAQEGRWGSALRLRQTSLASTQGELDKKLEELNQSIRNEVTTSIAAAEQTRAVTRVYWLTFTVFLLGLALAAAWWTVRGIVRPINELTASVQRITQGDLSQVQPLARRDEIGDLSRAFALMTDWLRESYEVLESRVAERTKALELRTSQLQVAAQVAGEITMVRDLEVLLTHAVSLIRDRFGFYHAGIFLTDKRGEFAVLRAATGEAGAEMLAKYHKLKVGETGIVGYVASSGQARIALDVGQDAVHFKNPLLPETRSEVGLPLKVGERIIGVLDVQSQIAAAFDEQSLMILQIIADQLATAIENARLVGEMETNLGEIERLYGTFSRQAWEHVVQTAPVVGYEYDGTAKLVSPLTPLIANSGVERLHATSSHATSPTDVLSPHRFPLRLRGEVIGTLDVWPQGDALSADETYLLDALSGRISQALESARLYAETQQRAEQERMVGEVTSQMRATLNVESVLKTAVEEIYKAMNLDNLVIQLTATPPLTDQNLADQEHQLSEHEKVREKSAGEDNGHGN